MFKFVVFFVLNLKISIAFVSPRDVAVPGRPVDVLERQ